MAAKFFKKKYPTINESTVRTVAKKYDENVKVAKACGQSPDRKLKTWMRGKLLMVGSIIDEKVRKFVVSLYKKGGHVSRSIAATTAMVLLSRTDGKYVKNVVVTTNGEKICYRELDFKVEQRLLAKLKYRTVQRKKQVYNIIMAT